MRLDPWESVGTLETEYEVFLHEQGRAREPIALEARPGSGELGPNGRRAGAITLDDLFEHLLRFNLDRIIVGEVRGGEVMAMFKAMQSGAGSLSTTHAKDARDTIERLITCVLSVHTNEAYAARLVAQHIDLIVHLTADPRPGHGPPSPRRRRGHRGGHRGGPPAGRHRPVRPGPDGRAVPVGPAELPRRTGPQRVRRLAARRGARRWARRVPTDGPRQGAGSRRAGDALPWPPSAVAALVGGVLLAVARARPRAGRRPARRASAATVPGGGALLGDALPEAARRRRRASRWSSLSAGRPGLARPGWASRSLISRCSWSGSPPCCARRPRRRTSPG